jgi:hypothetical protein
VSHVTASWSRAALAVRVKPKDPKVLTFPVLSLDDARSLIRELEAAVAAGQQHLHELKEQK